MRFFLLLLVGPALVNCNGPRRTHNPLLGEWNSLWRNKSQNVELVLNLNFESNYTFHVEVFGAGQADPIQVKGVYQVHHDTLVILDKIDEPKQMCSYSDTGMYTFTQRGDTMLFKVLNDRCERRKITFEIGLCKSERSVFHLRKADLPEACVANGRRNDFSLVFYNQAKKGIIGPVFDTRD